MGDAIESSLEETVPILRAAQRERLLTQTEITDIVRNRRNHEYAVSSSSVTREDFLRYAAFEREIAQVMKKRAERRKKKKHKTQQVIGKSAARVNLVYSRAVKKFKGDDELWLHYAKHCLRTGAERAAGRLFAKAIAFRPDSERVWLAAVAFHFDNCADAKGGRALAQKALRALPESSLLWKEYFRLEVLYLAKLISRRVALGLALTPEEADADPSNTHGNPNSAEGNEVPEQESREKGHGRKSSHASQKDQALGRAGTLQISKGAGSASQSIDSSAMNNASVQRENAAISRRRLSFWQGGVPMTVFRNACDKVSFSVDSCAEIWNIVASTPFVPIQLMESMGAALTEMCTPNIAISLLSARLTWDIAHAQFVIERASSEQKAGGSTGEDGRLTNLQSMKISLAEKAEETITAMRSAIIAELSGERGVRAKDAAITSLDGFKDLVATVDESGQITEQITALKEQINNDDVISALANEDHKTSKEPNSPRSPSEYGLNDLMDVVVGNREELSDALFEAFRAKVLVPFRDLKQERILCEWLSREKDSKRLRQVCDMFLPLPPKTIGSMRGAIDAEMRLWRQAQEQSDTLQADESEFIARTRRMFKLASDLSAARHDQDMWLDYIEFERKLAKDSRQANIVTRRASKALDKASFELLTERLALRNLET
eukprot:GFKZ01010693.1.p1 GENE.GFKZ01010693.1~~GFKZ01010693.1.p1  ORF type:complete len:665 (+),score=97.59 GFKZ01010693.1:147-2141(+)